MEVIKNQSYRELIVWQRSIQLVVEVYRITEQFPRSEVYGLTSQMRRASVSIPSNIAEGSRRRSRKDLRNFLVIAFSSGSELETQVEIVKALPFGRELDFIKTEQLLDEVMRMLNKMISNLD